MYIREEKNELPRATDKMGSITAADAIIIWRFWRWVRFGGEYLATYRF